MNFYNIFFGEKPFIEKQIRSQSYISPAPFNEKAEEIRRGDGKKHQENIDGLSPPVKDKAEDKQHDIAPFARQKIVTQKCQGKVCKQKDQG